LPEPDELTPSSIVTQLVRHIRQRDALADDSAVALALLIEGAPLNARLSSELFGDLAPANSEVACAEVTEKAVGELRRYVNETPLPLPSAIWALGKTQDPSLADMFASALVRALDVHAEPLAYQALAALTALPADSVPVHAIRLAAAKGHDDVRDLANDWLRLLHR
jgi:hypothetical protein